MYVVMLKLCMSIKKNYVSHLNISIIFIFLFIVYFTLT